MSYAPKVESVIQKVPGLIPVMITLTIKNGFDLADRIQHFKTGWSKMVDARRRGKSASCHDGKIEWNKIEGSLRSIEITLDPKTGWHVHGHVFALVTDYLDPFKLSEEWRTFTGDSFIVDVRKCKNGIIPGLIECIKYTTKFADMNPDELWQVHSTSAGSRYFDPQGALRGVPEPDIDSDDIEGLTGPWRDYLALWDWHRQAFALHDVPDDLPQRPCKE